MSSGWNEDSTRDKTNKQNKPKIESIIIAMFAMDYVNGVKVDEIYKIGTLPVLARR